MGAVTKGTTLQSSKKADDCISLGGAGGDFNAH